MHIKFWPENPNEKDLEDTDTERKILKCFLQKQCERVWTGFIWLRTGISGEYGNEHSDSIKRGEFLD
jgi:hypothetical protein